MRVSALTVRLVCALVGITKLTAFLSQSNHHHRHHHHWSTASANNKDTCNNKNAVPSRQYQTTKSVYGSADPRRLIKLTDYLRNPKPPVKPKEEEQNEPEEKEEQSTKSSDTTLPPTPPETTTTTTGKLVQLNVTSDLLQEAITCFNSNAANAILESFTFLKNEEVDAKVIDDLLDLLLAAGPDQRLPIWSRWRFLARYSNRARLASLRRTLDLMTNHHHHHHHHHHQPHVDTTNEEDTLLEQDLQQRRRRRALVSLLGTLANTNKEENESPSSSLSTSSLPAIVTIEIRVKREKGVPNI